jgi:hypothetical protein
LIFFITTAAFPRLLFRSDTSYVCVKYDPLCLNIDSRTRLSPFPVYIRFSRFLTKLFCAHCFSLARRCSCPRSCLCPRVIISYVESFVFIFQERSLTLFFILPRVGSLFKNEYFLSKYRIKEDKRKMLEKKKSIRRKSMK